MRQFGFLVLLLSFFPITVQAQVVEVTGRAFIDGAPSEARHQAIDDALHQASLQLDSYVSGTQQMQMGVLTQDEVRVNTQAQVKDVEILWEQPRDGIYEVGIRARVTKASACPAQTKSYRKAVAFAGFGLAKPQQATYGRLENIEQSLPRWLAANIHSYGKLQTLDATSISLFNDPRQAPSMESAQQRLTTSVALATELGAQYVVSGVVRDMALHQPQKAGFGLSRLMGGKKAPMRDLVVDFFIHDGLSGAMLFQQTYRTQGAWDAKPTKALGFATPDFWQTPYGGKVQGMLQAASQDIQDAIQCQPFMARIVKARGSRLHIEASASAGVRPGDTFTVYRTGTFYNLDLEPRTELTDMAVEAVVKQVQPHFIIADLEESAEVLAIQRDDMVIAW